MEYELRQFPDDFSGEVPLFALPNLVMFPGCVQPLHIFESRYCEMFEDVIQGDLLIGMATLLPGYEVHYYSRPPISDNICIGQVVLHEKTPKGTYNLVLVGQRRAVVQHEITPVLSYRRGMVDGVDERMPGDSQTCEYLFSQILQRLSNAGAVGEQLCEVFSRPGVEPVGGLSMMTDVVAFNLVADFDLKLKLLSESAPIVRGQLLLESDALSESEPPKRRSNYPPPEFGNN